MFLASTLFLSTFLSVCSGFLAPWYDMLIFTTLPSHTTLQSTDILWISWKDHDPSLLWGFSHVFSFVQKLYSIYRILCKSQNPNSKLNSACLPQTNKKMENNLDISLKTPGVNGFKHGWIQELKWCHLDIVFLPSALVSLDAGVIGKHSHVFHSKWRMRTISNRITWL